jgi:flagellin
MLSIQTNVNSLVAQQNLSVNNAFQSKTIQQLTSGYRINSSGDDAAGLAVANKYRSGVAELMQGVANGNDGVAQLQIMDGGMNNISQMLDRLKTLAMQSASQTFSGNRSTLNSEFQTDLGEIDRQAQSIGLNTGGDFAKSRAVYRGSGSGSQTQSNAVVTVDLSKSTVDTQSLGLSGYSAVKLAASVLNDYDLSAAGTNNVAGIMGGGNAGSGQFTFSGPGFGGTAAASGIQISPVLTGVNNTTGLVNALNAAIQTAANSSTAANVAAFKAANIVASVHTDSAGHQQLEFTSSNTAFNVTADDQLANALMGNLATATTGNAANSAGSALVASGAFELGTAGATGPSSNTAANVAWTTGATANQVVTINALDSSGTAHPLSITLAFATQLDSVAHAVNAINSALQTSNDSTLKQITAVADPTGIAGINFISNLSNFSVAISPYTAGGLGPAAGVSATSAIQVGQGGVADISTIQSAQAAVTAITSAVQALGAAQAGVGKGENVLNYAISLAQSQITNFSAAQAQIRDADVAAQAANLSKAQVLQQSSIAAMAQANSAPQAVLALLKG